MSTHLSGRLLRFVPFPLAPLTLASTLSCAAFQKPLVGPAEGGAAWVELSSAHFVLKTDLDPSDAQAASRKLEDTFAELSDLGFASDDKPKATIDVVYFRRRESYLQFEPATTGARFHPGGFHDFERRSVAVLGGDFDNRAREEVQHELTHRFVGYYYPQVPVWLNEGLAQYLETLDFDGDKAIIGRAGRHARFWKGDWRRSPGGAMLIPLFEAPSAANLRMMKPRDFYAKAGVDIRTPEGWAAQKAQLLHYQAAWALVHLLMESPKYQNAFHAYLDRLRAGERDATAWDGTVGSVGTSAELETDYKAALAPLEVTTLRTRYAPPALPAARVRAMDNAEVHLLWARLRDWRAPEPRAAAHADMEEARQAGSTPDLAMLDAVWIAGAGDWKGAESSVRAAAEAHPEDPRLWSALGWLSIEERAGAGFDRKEMMAILGPIAARLAPIAESPAQLDLLAHASLVSGQPDAALAYEKRAVAVDPNCVDCLAGAAMAMLDKGLGREALEVVTLAQGLSPEGTRPTGLDALVERARSAAASQPAPAGATQPSAPAGAEKP